MTKLSLDQFLREISNSPLKTNLDLTILNSSEFVDRDGNKLTTFLSDIQEHIGIFEIDGKIYDSAIFTGNDNIYFSYEFNSNNGKALTETLFILSSLQISKTSDNTYELVESTGQVTTLLLKD